MCFLSIYLSTIKIMNYLKSLLLMGCALVALNLAAGEVRVHDAQIKASQFLNQRTGVLSAMSPQELKLIHVEPAQVDRNVADYYVFNA